MTPGAAGGPHAGMSPRMAAVMAELEEQERRELADPGLVGPDERLLAITPAIGRLYGTVLRAMGARRVLEVGTSAGYSAMWFAGAVAGAPGASVTTIEADPAKVRRARANLERAGAGGIVTVVEGGAAGVLGRMLDSPPEPFDFAFIDADKEPAAGYLDAALRLVRRGGLVGVDNMLRPERFAPHMRRLAAHARSLPGVLCSEVPLDNGELLCVRL